MFIRGYGLVLVLGILNLISVGTLVHAKDRKPQQASPSKSRPGSPIHYTQSAPESSSRGSQTWALGFSTINIAPSGRSNLFGNAALSGMLQLENDDIIQGHLSLPSTDPFNFGVLGMYKHTVAKSGIAGFHIGGSFGIASLKSSAAAEPAAGFSVGFIGGFHFQLPNLSQILIHLDGGATLNIVGSSSSLEVGALSPAMGASILYAF